MSPDARTASPSSLTPSSILTDEAALKREFDAQFTSSLSAAHAQLGDATAMAPRVVETAFVNAWNQRGTIATADQLKVVLTDEIRHGAARALSRRHSAGRFAGGKHTQTSHAAASEAPADVWANVEKAIHASASSSSSAHAAAATTGRHEAASHMKAVGKRPSWIVPAAIGLFALVVSVGGMLYVDRLGEDDGALALVSSAAIQPLVATTPGQMTLWTTLGDGSKMKVGPETKVFVPDAFPDKARVIRIEGTAQFDVAKAADGKSLPFRVIAKRVHVIANGTSFVVSAYSSDSGMMVLVKEGSVTVKAGKTSTNVPAGQALLVENNVPRQPRAEERAQGFGWVDGQITVQHKQLRSVVAALTRWFNFDVKVPDLPLLDRDASIDVPLDSSRLAISQVEKSANVKFAYEGETKLFRDATKKK
jgi:ferric-dicitrate binding protein FerR (iron transport regulator)